IALAAVLAVFSAPLSAQWLHYPTAGVPRLPNRQPNLSAPAPRTADGKPDFSGTWMADTESTPDEFGGRAVPRTRQFRDIGAGLKEGLPYQPWAKELRDKRAADKAKENPDVRCLPLGILQMHTHPFPRRIVQ